MSIIAASADVSPDSVIGSGSRVWHLTQVRESTRSGSECVIGCGDYIAPGAVVTKDGPDFALVAEVPARRVGWVGRAGQTLGQEGSFWVCPQT